MMVPVSDQTESQAALSVGSVLCVDHEALDRWGRVLRHLIVGLVDQAIRIRLVSSDPRVKSLSLGPVQTVMHKPLVWPGAARRIEQLLDDLTQQPPKLVHAVSSASYRIGLAIAEAFDADLILQVGSLADCDAIANIGPGPVRRFVTCTLPLQRVLEEQLKLPADRIELIRPGMLASQSVACFSHSHRIPTILCASTLQRGSGIDRLIEAAAILKKQECPFMMFLFGTGKRERAVRRLIRERGLSASVTLVQTAGDLGAALGGGDIFVRPGSSGAFSDEILQAMAAGLAVVTAPDTIGDYCRDDETAVVCDKPKPESLAAVLAGLLDDRERAVRIADAGRNHIRTHHTVSAMAEKTAESYRTLALSRATFSLKE